MDAALALLMVLGFCGVLAIGRRGLASTGERVDAPPPAIELTRAAAGAPAVRAVELEAGVYVAVTGRVVGEAALRAPLTGRRCVAYDLQIRVGSDEVVRQTAAGVFAIADATGEVQLDGRAAQVRLPRFDRFPRLGQLRSGRKLIARLHLGGAAYDAFEAVLQPGEVATVIGSVDAPVASDEAGPYRSARAVRRLVPSAEPLVITTPA